MPQIDLETLVSACSGGSSDAKIACQTLANGDDPSSEQSDQPDISPDFPPESFWLSKEAELDWLDRNAFYERKDSTKGNANSTNSNQNSTSQRISISLNLKSKASIIGLPMTQTNSYVDTKNWRQCKPGNTRSLFPKRTGSTGKSDAPEPSSPNVSCMGRVRSKKEQRRRRNRRRSSETVPVKSRKGFLASFRAIFRSGCKDSTEFETVNATSRRRSVARDLHDIRNRLPESDTDALSIESTPRKSMASDAPGLGNMKRFVSGRRSGSWSSGIEI